MGGEASEHTPPGCTACIEAIAERDVAIEKAFAERERQTGMLAWAQEIIRERDERIARWADLWRGLRALEGTGNKAGLIALLKRGDALLAEG